jgi:hypothetical protein
MRVGAGARLAAWLCVLVALLLPARIYWIALRLKRMVAMDHWCGGVAGTWTLPYR